LQLKVVVIVVLYFISKSDNPVPIVLVPASAKTTIQYSVAQKQLEALQEQQDATLATLETQRRKRTKSIRTKRNTRTSYTRCARTICTICTRTTNIYTI
jgi:hypothetical protein